MRKTMFLFALLVLATLAHARVWDPTGQKQDPDTLFFPGSPRLRVASFMHALDEEPEAEPVLFDSGLQSWLDQQLGVIDVLQSLFVSRPPCSVHMTSSGPATDPSISYMATTRFGSAAVLTTFMQQISNQEDLLDDDEEDTEPPFGAEESLLFSVQGEEPWGSILDRAGSEAAAVTQGLPHLMEEARETGAAREGRDLVGKGESFMRQVWMPSPEDEEEPLGPHHPPPPRGAHASCWDLITFVTLLVGCIAVWGCLLRTAVRCRKLVRKHKKAARKAARSAPTTDNPLLAPLVREGQVSEHADVAVASHEAPAGAFYVPQGSRFIRVAYQPLANE